MVSSYNVNESLARYKVFVGVYFNIEYKPFTGKTYLLTENFKLYWLCVWGGGCVCMGCACVRVEGVSSKINIWGDWSRSHVYLVGVALGWAMICVRYYGASVYSASLLDVVSVNVQYIFCFGFHTSFYTLLYYLLSFFHDFCFIYNDP